MRNSGILVWLATLALAACGGGGNDSGSSFASSASAGAGSSAAANAASIIVQTSLASIPSDNSASATITAIVRDANNLTVPNVTVTPSTSSGVLTPVLPATGGTANVTDASGTVKYTLTTPGDATSRTITVSIGAGTATGQATVTVAASAATAPSIVVQSSLASIPSDNSVSATITATVRDANNVAVANVTVVPSTSSGLLTPVVATGSTANVTDASGSVKYTLTTGGDPSNRTITVSIAVGAVVGRATVTVSTSAVTVLLLSDATTIQSNGSTTAQISAYVRDANNNFIAGVPVSMTTTTGGLTGVVTQTGVAAYTTDSNGLARATLNTLGDPTNRTITVTARVGSATATANVAVVGSTLTVQGAGSFILNQTQKFTVALLDSGKLGIAGKTITVTAPANGTVSAASLVTDSQGAATFNVTATQGGSGTVSVTGLGLSAQQVITVNSDVVTFTTPAANAVIPLATQQAFTAVWTKNAVPQVGQAINFATTRGCVNPPGATCTGVLSTGSAITNAQGQATVQILSDNAGGATVTATVTGGTVASQSVQFISITPATIDVQASKFTIGPSEQSTITAVVRDAQNNLVANSTVSFTVSDVTGGTLTLPSAVTDAQGRAQTVYTAGSVASANNGVQITASVQGVPSVTPKSVLLTVAKSQLFISIGTGNTLQKINSTQYKKDYVLQVTDANGAGVSNVSLTASILSIKYFKGYRDHTGLTFWNTVITATCNDEDVNRNGILDTGEDFNNSGRIEAGNIASITPSTVTTDANGFAFVSIFYPQEYALYVGVTLAAQAQVQGTAFLASSTFGLDILAADVNDITVSPPGIVSPFGRGATCTDTL